MGVALEKIKGWKMKKKANRGMELYNQGDLWDHRIIRINARKDPQIYLVQLSHFQLNKLNNLGDF